MSQPLNPFPASAVARFSSAGATIPLTVSTTAIQRATTLVDEYLAEGWVKGEEGRGRVAAVVGDYGTGKTHIALTMLHRVAMAEGVRSLYLDAPADTFLSLYKQRFITQLSRLDLRRTVNEYFADIVAEDLGQSELTRPMALRLLDRSIDPHEVVQRVGLRESRYRALLTERLTEIIGQGAEPFAIALSLFMRAEFESAVWEWLCGNPPDTALVERGIDLTIDTDADALKAMGVIAHLYGGQQRRFVVVIDEMEKILGGSGSPEQDEEVFAALKRMMEIFSDSGALLILCGLPDFLEALPDDTRQRIPVTIPPTRLTAEDAVRFIEDVNEKHTGERVMKPFTGDVAAYLADLSGGNARRLIRLCFHAYAAATAAETGVTRAIVREAAREQFEIISEEDLRRDVIRVINRNGWRYEENRISSDPKRRIDYWIPVKGGGCAITLAKSVLLPADAKNVSKRAAVTVDSIDKRNIRRVLVINGYLGDEYRSELEANFDVILTHNLRTFSDDLNAALQGQIARDTTVATLDHIADSLAQSLRQNAELHRRVEDLADRLLGMRVLESAVEKGLTNVFATLSGHRPVSRFPRLEMLFDEILAPLEQVIESASPFRHGALSRHSMEIAAVSRVVSLKWIVESFRAAVVEQLSTSDSRSEIRDMCYSYDGAINGMSAVDSLDEIMRFSSSVRMLDNGARLRKAVSDLGREVHGVIMDPDLFR